jgi:hypothetical protein
VEVNRVWGGGNTWLGSGEYHRVLEKKLKKGRYKVKMNGSVRHRYVGMEEMHGWEVKHTSSIHTSTELIKYF